MPLGYENLLTNRSRNRPARYAGDEPSTPIMSQRNWAADHTSRQNMRLTVSRRFRQWLIALQKGRLRSIKCCSLSAFGGYLGDATPSSERALCVSPESAREKTPSFCVPTIPENYVPVSNLRRQLSSMAGLHVNFRPGGPLKVRFTCGADKHRRGRRQSAQGPIGRRSG